MSTVSRRRRRPVSRRLVLGGLLLAALLVAGVVSYEASGAPDGLERVAGDEGFASTEQESATAGSPLADYRADAVGDGRLATGVAGVVGVVVVLLLASGVAYAVRRRDPAPGAERDDLEVG